MTTSESKDVRAQGLRSFLRKLRESDIDRFAATATTGACRDLGFTKAMFSWVDGTSWRPESVFVSPDLGMGFDELIDAVDGSAVPLFRAPREADLVRYRRPYVLDQREYRHAYRPLIDLSNPTAYAAAPITVGGRTVAILHVDRHERMLDEMDLAILSRGARMCSLSYATLAARRRLLDQQDAARAVYSTIQTAPAPSADIRPSPPDQLTEREDAVLRLLATGASNRSIAEQLFISDGTVKSHVHHIFRKIDVQTRAQAAAYARNRRPLHTAGPV